MATVGIRAAAAPVMYAGYVAVNEGDVINVTVRGPGIESTSKFNVNSQNAQNKEPSLFGQLVWAEGGKVPVGGNGGDGGSGSGACGAGP